MAGIKDYAQDIEDYVIEAFDKGASNEHDVIAYVKTQMVANENDILKVANDFFCFLEYMKDHSCS